MDETELREIEQTLAVARRELPRTTWSLMGTLDKNVPALVAEVRRLQGVEREALRVLGAIINQHVQGRVDVPEEALLREYTVSRTNDPASMTVRFRAEPVDD